MSLSSEAFDSQPRISTPPLLPQRIGRYQLLAPIGAGGNAMVYLGRVTMTANVERDVAIKLMHPGLASAESDARQLLAEARVATRIRHPNVVPVLDVGEQDGRIFLVMEYVEGDSVSALLKQCSKAERRIPLPIVARIMIDALAGLHAAHELRGEGGQALELVHRDFTPHNILVSVDGNTRLTDFGIAKTSEGASLTRTGLVKGKVRYMAPEQALGQHLDRRCDIFAAGVVAWEMLTGKRMITADSEAAALLKIVSEEPPRVNAVRPDLPEEIAAALRGALTVERERRYATAELFRQRLQAAFATTSSVAEAADVASFLQEVVGPKLQRRRDSVEQALSAGVSTDDAPSATLATESRTTRRHARARIGLMAVATVFASVGAFALARWTAPDGVSITAVSVTNPEPSSKPASAASAPSASAQPPPPVRELELEGNLPIASVMLGQRRIEFPQAQRKQTLKLDPRELEAQPKLVARTPDGHTTELQLAADSAGAIAVRFRIQPHPRRPTGRTGRPAKPSKPALPGLAPAPY